MTAVVEAIVAVPTGAAAGAHLCEPWPDVARRAVDRDGMGQLADRVRNQLVSRKRACAFVASRGHGSERHHKIRSHIEYRAVCRESGSESRSPATTKTGFATESQSHGE